MSGDYLDYIFYSYGQEVPSGFLTYHPSLLLIVARQFVRSIGRGKRSGDLLAKAQQVFPNFFLLGRGQQEVVDLAAMLAMPINSQLIAILVSVTKLNLPGAIFLEKLALLAGGPEKSEPLRRAYHEAWSYLVSWKLCDNSNLSLSLPEFRSEAAHLHFGKTLFEGKLKSGAAISLRDTFQILAGEVLAGKHSLAEYAAKVAQVNAELNHSWSRKSAIRSLYFILAMDGIDPAKFLQAMGKEDFDPEAARKLGCHGALSFVRECPLEELALGMLKAGAPALRVESFLAVCRRFPTDIEMSPARVPALLPLRAFSPEALYWLAAQMESAGMSASSFGCLTGNLGETILEILQQMGERSITDLLGICQGLGRISGETLAASLRRMMAAEAYVPDSRLRKLLENRVYSGETAAARFRRAMAVGDCRPDLQKLLENRVQTQGQNLPPAPAAVELEDVDVTLARLGLQESPKPRRAKVAKVRRPPRTPTPAKSAPKEEKAPVLERSAPVVEEAPASPVPESLPEPEPPASAPSAPPEIIPEADLCQVCLEAKRTHVVIPCGHYLFCQSCLCGQKLCPYCRGPVTSTCRIYG